MPKVPNSVPQISMNVPGVQAPYTPQFGRTGEALERLGSNLGDQAMSLHDQVVHLNGLNQSAEALAKTKQDSDLMIQNLKLQSPDGFMHEDNNNPTSAVLKNADGTPRTIAQEYHEWADQHYQQAQEGMATPVAAQMYREAALPYITNRVTEMQTASMQMRVEADKVSQSRILQQYGDSLVTNPDVLNLYSNADDMTKGIKSRVGLTYNDTEANKKIQEAYNSLGRDAMQGAYTSVLDQKKEGDKTRVQDIMYWRDVLAGRDPISQYRKNRGLPTLSDMMDPVQKSVEEEKLIRLLPTARELDRTDLMTRFHATMTALQQGKSDDRSFEYLAGMINTLGTSKPEDASKAAEMMGQLSASREIGGIQGPDFDLKPLGERQAMTKDAEARAYATVAKYASQFNVPASGDLAQAATKAVTDTFDGINNQIEAEKQKDMAQFTQTRTPIGKKVATLNYSSLPSLAMNAKDIQKYAQLHEQLQRINPPANTLDDRAPITKAQSQIIADQLKNPAGLSERQAAQGVANLHTAYGKYFEGVVDQMIKDQQLGPQWRIAVLHARSNDNDITAQTAVITALRGSSAIDKQWLQMQESGKKTFTEQDLHDSVLKQFQPYVTKESASHPGGVEREALNEAVTSAGMTYAKKLMLEDPNMTADSAAKTAYQRMIGGFTNLEKSGGGGWIKSGPVRVGSYEIPVSFAGRAIGDTDKANIRTNLNSYMSEEGLKKLNPYVPPGPQADHFLSMVARNVYPAYDPGKGGYVLWYNNGGSTDGVQSATKRLTTKDRAGREVPVVIPMEKLLPAPPQGPGVIEQGLNLLKKWLPADDSKNGKM